MSPTKKPHVPENRRDRNVIGSTITRLRRELDLTRDQLAAKAQIAGWDISAHVIKKIERGEREVTDIDIIKLARILKVPIEVLFD